MTSTFDTIEKNILQQLEQSLIPELILKNTFLLSCITPDHLLTPENLLEGLPNVKSLTSDKDQLVQVIMKADSKNFSFDKASGKIKLKSSPPRTTIILRDVPPTVTSEKIRDLFEKNGFEVVSIKSEIGNCWFVKLTTEEVVLKAFSFVHTQEIDGVPLKARIKSESFVRSFFVPSIKQAEQAKSANSNILSSSQETKKSPTQVPQTRKNSFPRENYAHSSTYSSSSSSSSSAYSSSYPSQSHFSPQNKRSSTSNKNYNNNINNNNNNNNNNFNNFNGSGSLGSNNNSYRYFGTSPHERKGFSPSSSPSSPPMLGYTNFPPLPSKAQAKVSGYSSPFLKYSKDELVVLFQDFKTKPIPERPTSLLPRSECVATVNTPNLEISFLNSPLRFNKEEQPGVLFEKEAIQEQSKQTTPSTEKKPISAFSSYTSVADKKNQSAKKKVVH